MNQYFVSFAATASTLARGWRLAGVALVWLCIANASWAHDIVKGDLLLDHPYATPSAPGQTTATAHLRGIKNRGDAPDRLLGASTPVAARVEMQQLVTEAGHLHPHAVPFIVLPAQSLTLLRHTGDYQLVLIDLKHPIKDGDRFELTLKFERAGTQSVKVWVQTPREAAAEHSH
jgi:copper(I)-binding protein